MLQPSTMGKPPKLCWLLPYLALGACICPFERSACRHMPNAERYMHEFGACEAEVQTTEHHSAPTTLSESDIGAVVHDHDGEITWCYQSLMSAIYPPPSKGPEGRILVDFLIAPDGTVHSAEVRSDSLNSSSLRCCVLSKCAAWRFPQSSGFSEVLFPYVFLGGHPPQSPSSQRTR